MNHTHKLTARTVVLTEVSAFSLTPGEPLDERVRLEIDKANAEGRLDKLATNVGLPPFAVSIVGEGENLTGGENIIGHELYSPYGEPLSGRSYRIEDVGDNFVAMAVEEGFEDRPIGVFQTRGVAETVAIFWRNGHLPLDQ